MTEAHPSTSPNFIRDQFILTVILIGALFCRSSIVSSKPEQASDATHATQPHAIEPDTVASAK